MCKMDEMTDSKKEYKINLEKIRESLLNKREDNKQEIEFLLKRL